MATVAIQKGCDRAERAIPAARRAGRVDIQLLRALAVALVAAFHGFPRQVPDGNLGVDAFFVISGFLVTNMLVRDGERGHLSVRRFFVRRARRLLPASLCTLLVATLAAALLIRGSEWREYGWQLLAASTLTADFYVRHVQHAGAAVLATRPLAHFWSLSVEEQFYILFPFVFIALGRRSRATIGVIAAAAVASFLLSTWLNHEGHRADAYLMLPTRAWQLLAGSVCAMLPVGYRAARWPAAVFCLACVVIFLAATGALHTPRLALLVVLATVVILMSGGDTMRLNLLTTPLAAIGDWSYSIYLIHVPVLAFSRIFHGGALPPAIVAALLGLSVLLAWLQYRFVEEPFRGIKRNAAVPVPPRLARGMPDSVAA